MADKEKKVDEAQEPVTEQVELVGEAAKAEAAAVEALPKVEEAEVPKAEKTAAKPSKTPANYTPRLKGDYEQNIVKAMTEKFGYKNALEVPRIDKIVLNMGIGEGVADRKKVEQAADALTAIVGQKAVITRSRKSIANYKLRDGQAIGCKVTLRKTRMYEFLDRLVNIALPRVRDFRGLSAKSFDGRGNYALGIKEQIVFPEVDYDQVETVRGMDIVIVTSAKTDEEARALLKAFDFPFVS